MSSSAVSPRRQYFELFLASLISLYFELLIVRWLAAEVRIFSYFKNLTMMAAFMGLGVGFAFARRSRDYRSWLMPVLWLYVPIVLIVSQQTGLRPIVVPEGTEYIWRASELPVGVSVIVFALILLLFFMLTMLVFVVLGQLTGRRMIGIPPLSAYVVNLLGSLAGIWLFSGLSYLYTSPWLWFGLGLVLVLYFWRHSLRQLAVNAVAAAALVGVLLVTQGATMWSPYYRINVFPLRMAGEPVGDPAVSGYELYANQVAHEDAVNLSDAQFARHPEYADILTVYRSLYDLPYAFKQPRQILVVGSGLGNDIAAALRHEVQQIDAVEIDPQIHQLGLQLHPEQPYAAPNVRVIIDDARSYLEKTTQTYDMIVFGILDSQTLLSGMSSVRLDNFVYTVESLQQARERLAPGGVIALTFNVERPFIKQRISQILTEVFGAPPHQLLVNRTRWNLFVAGSPLTTEAVQALCVQRGCTVEVVDNTLAVPVATDDWPYLYLERRDVPLSYWVVLLVVVLIAWGSRRVAFAAERGLDWHFFLLGAAFLLIEFKIVTELALLFGSTWIVNSIAVSAVLVMVLFANLVVARLRRVNLNLLYGLLAVTLTIGWLTPLNVLLPLGTVERLLGAVVLTGLPLFFASMIFSTSLKQASDVSRVFGSNFFGSAVGGVIEYASLALGISALYVIGAALYLVSWFVRPRGN